MLTSDRAIGREEPEGAAHLPERADEDFQVAPVGLALREVEDQAQHLRHQVLVDAAGLGREPLLDLLHQLGQGGFFSSPHAASFNLWRSGGKIKAGLGRGAHPLTAKIAGARSASPSTRISLKPAADSHRRYSETVNVSPSAVPRSAFSASKSGIRADFLSSSGK